MQSKKKNIRKDFMHINVRYYFLYLLEPTIPFREKFDEISNVIHDKTENLTKVYEGFNFIGKPSSDSEEWCKLEREFEGDKWEVKYYKERLILKVTTKIDAPNLNKLFKEAKKKRKKLLENKLVKLEEVQTRWREICKKFLFSWDNIPGNDTDNLKNFLNLNFGIEWIKEAQIKKSDNQIKIFHEKNYLSLKLNVYKTKVKLEIDDGRKYEFISLTENNKQNIYCECIQSVYLYPLIEVEKEYERDDFDEDEAITTFFYEIPDVGEIKRFLKIFPIRYRKVLMRVSGPSVMTTKMSDIMRFKLINMLYESALYKMRESERKSNYRTECKKIFGSNYEYLRKYIAEIFFSIESGSSGIESGSSFQILSIISAFGALASIIGISYAIYILPSTFKILNASLLIILFFFTILLLASIVGRGYSNKKIIFILIVLIMGLFAGIYYFKEKILLNLQ